MKSYLSLIERVFAEGSSRPDRTGVGTTSVFGAHLSIDLRRGMPILTTKKLHIKSVVTELMWMLRGDTNVRFLQDRGVSIWNEWADEEGNLGPVYGHQWRRFDDRKDQIATVRQQLREDPYSRRILVSAWNPNQLDEMKLPPCHLLFQLYVSKDTHVDSPMRLSCQMYQRSADVFLGVPFNIAFYAMLTHLFAWELGWGVGSLHVCFGDLHLYNNHHEQAKLQLSRQPRPLPEIEVRGMKPSDGMWKPLESGEVRNMMSLDVGDIALHAYDPHPHIPAKVAV